MKTLAPIALFVYNRPAHTRRTLEALTVNPEARESTLHLFCDGPKPSASLADLQAIAEVRRVVRESPWCGRIEIHESSINLGLAKSIVQGVTTLVKKHGRIIVLEDDIRVTTGFLRYMNVALDIYENSLRVMQVSAYAYPTSRTSQNSTYFLKAMSCWGWATWARAWQTYDDDAHALLSFWTANAARSTGFNLDGSGDYLDQLQANVDGRKSTWAVKWFASWMKHDGLCLYPTKSLAQNEGHDNSGTNCSECTCYAGPTIDSLEITRQRDVEDRAIRKSLIQYYRKHLTAYRNYPGPVGRLASKFSKLFGSRHLRKLAWAGLKKIHPNFRIFDRDGFRYYHDSFIIDSELEDAPRLDYPHHLQSCSIGRYTYLGRNSWVTRTKIGRFCSIGPNFTSGWGSHPTNGISTSPMFYSTHKQNGHSFCGEDKLCETAQIHIGNDVFIGMNVTVLDGVSIGDGAVIGAGAVVSKDIPPYAIAVGCPITILKYRFDNVTIAELLRLKWWEWGDDQLQDLEKHFFDVSSFLNSARKLDP